MVSSPVPSDPAPPAKNREYRILVLEDDIEDAKLMELELRNAGINFAAMRVDTRESFLAALEEFKPDVILSDYNLPSFDGMTALSMAKEKCPGMPFIFISNAIEEKLAVEMIRKGAVDYVLKDHMARLAISVNRVLREVQERSERKKTEETLKRTEEQFRQAQKMEAVGRLAGGVAHDFNNLLTAIMGYTDFLRASHAPDDRAQEDIIEIKKAAVRAASLTRQLLAFSRRQVMHLKVLNLNGIMSELGKMIRRLIGEDIDLVISLDPELKPIKADEGQLEQVILNLAVNARDAMPKGGRLEIKTADVNLGEQHIRSHPYVQPGGYVLLSMRDSGCGMSKEILSHIFEPFFTTKEKGKGTGLGLSTVYGIVKQFNGYVEVESEVGGGSQFGIYLPVTKEPASQDGEETPLVTTLEGTETVLLVEDEEAVRNLTSRFLKIHGYTVIGTGRPEQALRLFEENTIDLLLTDITLPGSSGLDIADRLKARRPDLKALYFSGYADNIILFSKMEQMRRNFIPKPFTPEELLKKVREVLDARPSEQRRDKKSDVLPD